MAGFYYIHSGQKCLPRVACLWSKMPMLQRVGMREGGGPLPQAFQYGSIFDSYDMKTLLLEFGNDIFTGLKMPTL